jgi:hypothetical protein
MLMSMRSHCLIEFRRSTTLNSSKVSSKEVFWFVVGINNYGLARSLSFLFLLLGVLPSQVLLTCRKSFDITIYARERVPFEEIEPGDSSLETPRLRLWGNNKTCLWLGGCGGVASNCHLRSRRHHLHS